MFNAEGGSSFNGDLSSWDVSQVTIMDGCLGRTLVQWRPLFVGCQPRDEDVAVKRSFNFDISSDVSQVTDMTEMFNGASSFNRPSAGTSAMWRHRIDVRW